MAEHGQTWPNMDANKVRFEDNNTLQSGKFKKTRTPFKAKHGQTWQNMAKHGRTWTQTKFALKTTTLFNLESLKRQGHLSKPNMAKHGRTWPNMAEHGRKQSSL